MDIANLDQWSAGDVQELLRRDAAAGKLSPAIRQYYKQIGHHELSGRRIVNLSRENLEDLRKDLEEDLSKYSAGKLVDAIADLRDEYWEKRDRDKDYRDRQRDQDDRDDRAPLRRRPGEFDDDRASQVSYDSIASRDNRRGIDNHLDDRSDVRSEASTVVKTRRGNLSGYPGVYRDHRDRRASPSVASGADSRWEQNSVRRWGKGLAHSKEDERVRELGENVGDWERGVHRMGGEYNELQKKLDSAIRNVSRCFGDHAEQKRTYREYKSICNSIKAELKQDKKTEELARLRTVMDNLADGKKVLDRLGRLKRRNDSPLLKLFVGSVSVRSYKDGELSRLKDSYATFQYRFLWGFFAFPFGVMITGFSVQVNCLLQLFLFVYYGSSAIRLSILHLHGANVDMWWNYYCYLGMVTAVVAMLTPDYSPLVWSGVLPFIASLFYILQGGVVLMQCNKLRDRVTAQSMGLTSDPLFTRGGEGVSVESIGKSSKGKGSKFLLPMMAAGAIFEVLFALAMFLLSFQGSVLAIPQGLLLSVCWLLRGGCNATILTRTFAKRRPKKKKKTKTAEPAEPAPGGGKKRD